MQLNKRYPSGQRVHFLYVFLFGFFAGIFLMNFCKASFLGETGFLDESFLYQMKYREVKGSLLFLYVLRKRMSLILFLMIFSTTYLGIVFSYGALVWTGFNAGMLMAAISIRYGFKGLFFIGTAIFPHYLFYIPAFIYLCNWCYVVCAILYFPAKVYEQTLYRGKKSMLLGKVGQAVCILAVVIIGAVLESYVNPFLVTGMLKIF